MATKLKNKKYKNLEDDQYQGFSYLVMGCLSCQIWHKVSLIDSAFIIEEREDFRRWQCPRCKGNYGIICGS